MPAGATDVRTPDVATGGGTAQPPDDTVQPPDSTAQPPDAAERLSLIKRVLSRLPPSNGQRAVYRALYQAGDAGLTWPQLYEGTGRTNREMMGTLGTLGRRINETDGAERFGWPGIGLLLDIRRVDGDLCYRLQPFFRRALDEDPDLKSRALKK